MLPVIYHAWKYKCRLRVICSLTIAYLTPFECEGLSLIIGHIVYIQ